MRCRGSCLLARLLLFFVRRDVTRHDVLLLSVQADTPSSAATITTCTCSCPYGGCALPDSHDPSSLATAVAPRTRRHLASNEVHCHGAGAREHRRRCFTALHQLCHGYSSWTLSCAAVRLRSGVVLAAWSASPTDVGGMFIARWSCDDARALSHVRLRRYGHRRPPPLPFCMHCHASFVCAGRGRGCRGCWLAGRERCVNPFDVLFVWCCRRT